MTVTAHHPAPLAEPARRMVRRMPRLQVYLPDDLYREVKARRIKASELLQEAVRAEVRRQERIEGAEKYIAELVAEVGEPSAEDEAWAAELVRGLVDRSTGWAD
jgi:post-segregation antitoxin (ccd killing protein)